MFSSAHRLVLVAVAVLCLAAPISASAATTRYASPTGTGTAPCLEPTSPCNIETAVAFGNTTNGDTILLAPGTYHPTVELKIFRPLTISGEPGKAAPLIEATGEFGLYMQEQSTVRDIRIYSPLHTSVGLGVGSGTVERVESTGEAAMACSVGPGTVKDSLCVAIVSGTGGTGFVTSGGGSELAESNISNVTAIGGGEGIVSFASEQASVTLNATNTIASGGSVDVAARSFTPDTSVHINLSHSNFETFEEEGVETEVTEPTEAGNQIFDPVFVDEAAGDYSEAEVSLTRLAGDLAAVLPGETDLAGNPRTTNCYGRVAVDIGAYQYECPPPVAGESFFFSTLVHTGPPSPSPAATAPVLSKLKLKPSKFTVTGKAKKGTTISFTLSTAASVKLEVLGKKTVKGKKPKTVTLGSLASVPGRSGANKVKFNGKVKGKPLEPGKYTLRATATGAGGSSAPVKTGFEVLIP